MVGRLNMAEEFFSFADMQRKLEGCIIRYKGEPHSVHVAQGLRPNIVKIRKLDLTSEWKNVDVTEDDFDIQAVPLGYVNFNNQAVYFYREAQREVLCTTHPTRLRWKYNEGEREKNREIDVFTCPSFADMIMNKYPSFDEVVSKLSSKEQIGNSIAFNRMYCVSRRNRARLLMFRGKLLGTFNSKRKLAMEDAPDFSLHMRLLNKCGVHFDA